MSEPLDWNAKTIAEFRENEGRVGGTFEGAPMVLVHHRGRTSGREYVTPVMYLPDEAQPDIIYVFATKAGASSNPDWYHNLAAAGISSIERGTETYKVAVRELTGTERDRIYAEQARRYPQVLPVTSGKLPESAPFLCSHLGERSPHPCEPLDLAAAVSTTLGPRAVVACNLPLSATAVAYLGAQADERAVACPGSLRRWRGV